MVLGEPKSNKSLDSINDSGDESDLGDLFPGSQRAMGNFFPCGRAEFYRHPDTSLIEEAGKTESEAKWEADEKEPIYEERGFKRGGKSEHTEGVGGEHDLAILRTCRQVYAEASPLFYSMVKVVIPVGLTVDPNDKEEIIERSPEIKHIRPDYRRHSQSTGYEKGIFDILGLASVLDFAAFARIERICFEAYYCFYHIDDSPSLFVDDDFHTSSDDEAELISFMKRTRTMENFVSLLDALPRLRQLDLELVVVVKPQMDLDFEDGVDDESLEKMTVANERATEVFIECGMLDPLRKLSNVQHFHLEVQTEACKNDEDEDFMMLKPKHARMVQDLREVIEYNWTTRSSIHC